MRILACLAVFAAVAYAQPHAVMAKAEPHHHLVFEDGTIRVLRVRVPARDSTFLHQHDPDYFWIALGPSTIVNAKPGVPDGTVVSRDLAIHYTAGNFAHVARNPGNDPFDNITVELLRPQSGLESLCSLVTGDVMNCDASEARKHFLGASELPSFRTNIDTGGRWVGGTFHPTSPAWSLTNHATHPIKALAIVATE